MHNPVLRARSLVALAATLAALTVSLLAAAPRASAAQQACGYDGTTYYACLRFDPLPYLWWNGVAFLHVNMPQQYAREIIACGGDFKAKIWGDDDDPGDDFIRTMVLDPAAPPTVDYAGILVNFIAPTIANDQLDEDDGADELYVETSFRDCHTGLTRTFRSSDYKANFGWG
jgi:hypothetical protein